MIVITMRITLIITMITESNGKNASCDQVITSNSAKFVQLLLRLAQNFFNRVPI